MPSLSPLSWCSVHPVLFLSRFFSLQAFLVVGAEEQAVTKPDVVSGRTHPVLSVHQVPLLPGECRPAQPLQEGHQLLPLALAAGADLEE